MQQRGHDLRIMLAEQLYERLRDAQALPRWIGLSETEFELVVDRLERPVEALNAGMKARSDRLGIFGMEYTPFTARESLLMVLLWSRLGLTYRAVAKLFNANGWTVRRRIRETRDLLFQLYPEIQMKSARNGVRGGTNSATMLWSVLGDAVRGSQPEARLRDAIDPDYESYFFEELEGETAPLDDDRIPPLTETRLGEGMQTLYRRIKSNTIPIETVVGGYLVAIVSAELSILLLTPVLGLILYVATLFVAFTHASLIWDRSLFRLLVSLSIVPLLRILSLMIALLPLPVTTALLVAAAPLAFVTLGAYRLLGYSRPLVGLTFKRLPMQALTALSGLGLGVVQYLLQSGPVIRVNSLAEMILPALLLIAGTGLLEEFIFRGLIQRSAFNIMRWRGVVYVALIYAVLQLGGGILFAALSFATGVVFGVVTRNTRSVLGAGLAHGIANVVALVFFPYLFG